MEQGGEAMARVLSVNVGRAREFDYNGRPAKSAIWKSPVAGRIAARGVIVEGAVGAGDEIRIIERPAHDLTIRDIFRIYTRDREEVGRLLAIPRMSESWREWARNRLQKEKDRRADPAAPGCC